MEHISKVSNAADTTSAAGYSKTRPPWRGEVHSLPSQLLTFEPCSELLQCGLGRRASGGARAGTSKPPGPCVWFCASGNHMPGDGQMLSLLLAGSGCGASEGTLTESGPSLLARGCRASEGTLAENGDASRLCSSAVVHARCCTAAGSELGCDGVAS